MSAVDRAAELGAAHGRESAEAWLESWIRDDEPDYVLRDLADAVEGKRDWPFSEPESLPRPDLGRLWIGTGAGSELFLPPGEATRDAYCAAFRDAVEKTVRARTEGAKP